MSSVLDHETETPAIQAEPTKPGIRTDPSYRWDTKQKTSSGSRLRIKPDGTVSYHGPNCLKYQAPGSKPFKLPALNPREETTRKTFERLKVSIVKQAGKDPQANFARYVGRPIGNGWMITATDGRRALLERGEGSGDYSSAFERTLKNVRLVCSMDNPEFHLALKRALIMTEEKSAMVRFIGGPRTLKLSSAHEAPEGTNDAGDFEETLQVNCGEPWHVALDGDYIEEACGSWPLAIWHEAPDQAVMLEPFDSSWRLIIAPIKALWHGVELGTEEPGSEPETTNDSEPVEPKREENAPIVEGSEAYREAYAKHGIAVRTYTKIRDGFHAKLVNETDFLQARAIYDSATRDFDKAFEAEQNSETPEISNGEVQVTESTPAACEHEYDWATMAEVPCCIKCGEEGPVPSEPLQRFYVISYDTDQQRANYDILMAENEDKALEIIGELRPENIPISAFTIDELRIALNRMTDQADADILENMASLKSESEAQS